MLVGTSGRKMDLNMPKIPAGTENIGEEHPLLKRTIK